MSRDRISGVTTLWLLQVAPPTSAPGTGALSNVPAASSEQVKVFPSWASGIMTSYDYQTSWPQPRLPQDRVNRCWGPGVCWVSEKSHHCNTQFLSYFLLGMALAGVSFAFLLALGQSPVVKNTLRLHLPATLTHIFSLPLWQTLLAGPGATQGHTSTAMLHLPVLRHMITGGCPKGVHRGGKHANSGWHGEGSFMRQNRELGWKGMWASGKVNTHLVKLWNCIKTWSRKRFSEVINLLNR